MNNTIIIHFSSTISQKKRDEYKNIISELIKIYNPLSFKQKYIFTLGGDGTFIEAFAKYGTEYIYIPINVGTLGFYTSWTLNTIEDLFKNFKNNILLKAPLLNIKTTNKVGTTFNYLCINESTLLHPTQTLITTININNNKFENFRGTGLCFSTPTGSTAYNKSLNGAIIDPSKNLFQLTKIAPINNNAYRTLTNSLILDNNNYINITPEYECFEEVILTVDRMSYDLTNICDIEIKLAQKYAKILINSNLDFWKRIQNSFL